MQKCSSLLSKVNKPWGEYEDFYRSEKVVFKIITINQGEELSYQVHEERDEFWVVLEGQGIIILDDEEYLLTNEDGVMIPAGTKHTVRAQSTLRIAELQFGKCSEEDIVRLYDKYNR